MTTVRRPRSAAVLAQISPAKLAPMMTRSTCLIFVSLAFQRGDPDRRHLVLAFLEYLEAETVEAEGLSHLWNHSRLMDHKACNGVGFIIGQVPVESAVQVADRHAAIHQK